ncbi:hypothetical protein [Verrucosispora sioxanthis]|uniref:hypothetical protein n=1 Tax=Verrucosispora sioxanthis TaxID=2499994 RepID=UPI00209F5017|nr:hypothetical protein [Verrucosispora sioxanthis]
MTVGAVGLAGAAGCAVSAVAGSVAQAGAVWSPFAQADPSDVGGPAGAQPGVGCCGWSPGGAQGCWLPAGWSQLPGTASA